MIAASSARLWRILKLVRIRPFDRSTAGGRAQERHRRIVITAMASMGSRGMALLTVLISVPLTLRYLGAERYGLWMTIASVLSMLGFADFGLSNGLLTMVAQASGREDWTAVRRYVSSAFFMLAAIALALTAIFSIAYPFIPWSRVFNVESAEAVREAGPATAIAFACFVVNVPLAAMIQAQWGLQDGFINHLWQSIGSILGLVGILLVVALRGGLPWLLLAFSGAPLLTSIVNAIVFLVVRRPDLRPAARFVHARTALSLMKTGALFFVLQLAMVVGFYSDNIVVAQILGAEQVAQYSVPARLAGFAPMIVGFALAPLWPAYGEALARGDDHWVRRTFMRSMILALLVTAPVALMLVTVGPWVLRWWAGPQITPSWLLLVSLAVKSMLISLAGPLSMLLNGARVIRFQVICATCMAGGSIALSIMLTTRIGVSGVVFGSMIAYLLSTLAPCAVFVPRFLRQLGTHPVAEESPIPAADERIVSGS